MAVSGAYPRDEKADDIKNGSDCEIDQKGENLNVSGVRIYVLRFLFDFKFYTRQNPRRVPINPNIISVVSAVLLGMKS
jgi:hypothetical protein